jgi:hypothetical protein
LSQRYVRGRKGSSEAADVRMRHVVAR